MLTTAGGRRGAIVWGSLAFPTRTGNGGTGGSVDCGIENGVGAVAVVVVVPTGGNAVAVVGRVVEKMSFLEVTTFFGAKRANNSAEYAF